MHYITWLVGGLIAAVIAVLTWNFIHMRWFYRPSRETIAELLSRALINRAKHGEIDYFISMPARNDALIEDVRQQFGSLYGPTSFVEHEGSQVWTPQARQTIKDMIASLRAGR